MRIIERPLYLERLKRLKGKPDIKIITGIRRCGKSELLKAFMAYVQETEPQSNIMYADLMDLENEGLREYHALYDYFTSRYKKGVSNYVLIDEVQLCDRFEMAVNSLYNKGCYDIYITGSNAFLLSSDLATYFTGRFIELHVYPFSFAEYLDYSANKDLDAAFDSYVLAGGMPGGYLYESERDRTGYIRGIFETIITRDLKQKYRLPDDTALTKTADYLLDNIGNLTSPNGISNVLKHDGLSANHNTVGTYIEYLCRSFLFYKVPRYDVKGRKILKTLEKYYEVDCSFRYARLGRRNFDYGRQYENLVALELLRRGYTVYVGKLYQKEIDFVAMDDDRKIYIQVCDDLSSEKTREREAGPLLAIRDAYPKMIIGDCIVFAISQN